MIFTPMMDGKLYPSKDQITAENLQSWINKLGPITSIQVLAGGSDEGCFYAEVSFE